ncbi:2OG-Fe(II) oxygenase family protein [Streptomyces sp. NPDC056831]|uniref:2OG-Fe(II) oxygenase family protein n=1 Tax=Streptomyces sp. NPDC056831 TaxID=3345954 RepID=UPI00369DA093
MMRILTPSWAGAEPVTHPYPWMVFPPGTALPHHLIGRLTSSFPKDCYSRRDASTRDGGKTYRNWSRPAGSGELDSLWRDLLADLSSAAYRELVAAALDLPEAGDVELRFVRHARGDWLDPHVDSPDKVFSHIFYFAEQWQPDWGGHLEILGSADPGDVVASIPPLPGQSVLMARTDRAWHQVSRVANHVPISRASLLVHGWRKSRDDSSATTLPKRQRK